MGIGWLGREGGEGLYRVVVVKVLDLDISILVVHFSGLYLLDMYLRLSLKYIV